MSTLFFGRVLSFVLSVVRKRGVGRNEKKLSARIIEQLGWIRGDEARGEVFSKSRRELEEVKRRQSRFKRSEVLAVPWAVSQGESERRQAQRQKATRSRGFLMTLRMSLAQFEKALSLFTYLNDESTLLVDFQNLLDVTGLVGG